MIILYPWCPIPESAQSPFASHRTKGTAMHLSPATPFNRGLFLLTSRLLASAKAMFFLCIRGKLERSAAPAEILRFLRSGVAVASDAHSSQLSAYSCTRHKTLQWLRAETLFAFRIIRDMETRPATPFSIAILHRKPIPNRTLIPPCTPPQLRGGPDGSTL